MSGGVDSSVAAALIQEQGYEVEGVTMRLLSSNGAGDDETIARAAKVCEVLGIPHQVVDLSEAFETIVIDNFAHEYEQARTPNPCIVCNEHIKFGLLWDWMDQSGFDFLATGHYATAEDTHLKRPKDRSKDQTYFLYRIERERLPRILFPLATWYKTDVKEYASEHGLDIDAGKESQDACFIEGKDRCEIIKEHYPDAYKPGSIVTSDGLIVGLHEGLANYTIGQRHGLGVSGTGAPLYVIGLDQRLNKVVVGSREEGKVTTLTSTDYVVDSAALGKENGIWPVSAKARYNMIAAKADLEIKDGIMTVKMDEELSGISPGQSVVCYHYDTVMGGGVISCVV